MRGVVVKCSRERVRLATDEEWLGAELIKHLQDDMKAKLTRSGERGYLDIDLNHLTPTYNMVFLAKLMNKLLRKWKSTSRQPK